MRARREEALLSIPSDRTLGCLLGGILGMLVSCCLAIGLLMLPSDDSPATGPPAPSVYDIEAAIDEGYINRMFLESTGDISQPVQLSAGQLDVRPHGRADFTVQADVGPLHPIIRGTVLLRVTQSGELQVELTEVRLGSLTVTRFVPDRLLDDVTRDVNRQLKERTGAANLRLVGVTSDETAFHFYLISTE